MRILFICNQNKHRSKTAEELLRSIHQTRSAGLYNDHPVTQAQLDWADIIIVMEQAQRTELIRRYAHITLHKRILCLDIPDIYNYNQPELKRLIQQKCSALLQPLLKL